MNDEVEGILRKFSGIFDEYPVISWRDREKPRKTNPDRDSNRYKPTALLLDQSAPSFALRKTFVYRRIYFK
jgi:hypothetical protein